MFINAPGKAHEAFFTEAGDPMLSGTSQLPPPTGAPNVPRLLEIGRRNGVEFLV